MTARVENPVALVALDNRYDFIEQFFSTSLEQSGGKRIQEKEAVPNNSVIAGISLSFRLFHNKVLKLIVILDRNIQKM